MVSVKSRSNSLKCHETNFVLVGCRWRFPDGTVQQAIHARGIRREQDHFKSFEKDCPLDKGGSCQNIAHHFAIDVGQAEIASGVTIGQLLVV